MNARRHVRRALTALLLMGSPLLLAGCGGGSDDARPAADAPGDVQANFDTDLAASSALRDRLAREFGMAPDIERLEASLSAEDFFCGPDPGHPEEMACLRERPRGSCVEASLVHTRPWRPDRAQVVVICEPGQSPDATARP